MRPKTGQVPYERREAPKAKAKAIELQGFSREIQQPKNQRLATPIGCELFRPCLVSRYLIGIVNRFDYSSVYYSSSASVKFTV